MRDSEESWPCGMGRGSAALERWPVVANMAFVPAPGDPYRLAGRKHRSSDGQTIGLAPLFERVHMFSMAFRSATIVLRTTPQQAQVLWRHAGARRFAYNACVANIHALLARKDDRERGPLPWSPFDNISYFYRFKKSAAAGVAEDGTPGIPWRREVHQRVFDEGAKDCGRAMAQWGAYCKARKQAKKAGRKPPRKVGPPQFSRRHGGKATFRILTDAKHTYITVLREGLRLPCFGVLAIGQSTRTLRRMLRAHKDPKRTAYITQVTFHFDHAKARWKATLAITWTPSQPVAPLSSKSLGCDVGLRRLVTVADEDGGNLAFHLQPTEIAKNYARMRKAQRQLGLKRLTSDRKKEAEGADRRTVSKSEVRAQRKLQRRHVRIKNVRQAHMHALTNRLVQTHGRFGLEGLHIQGMLRNHRVAGKIARQAWREFRQQIQYKAAWKQKMVVVAPAFFPSSKLCSQCGNVKADLPRDAVTYHCSVCQLTLDRDVNAAINLARYAPKDVPGYEEYSVPPKSRSWHRQATPEGVVRAGTPQGSHGPCGEAMVSTTGRAATSSEAL